MSADANNKIDAARIDLALGELRLPGVKRVWAALAATADKEGFIPSMASEPASASSGSPVLSASSVWGRRRRGRWRSAQGPGASTSTR